MSSPNKNLIDTTSEGTGRIEAFTDGVLAIAITLLVLEIKVPHVEADHSLTEELLKLWPSYGAYIISFLVIGIIWINNHQLFKLIERTDQYFLVCNIFFLMVVSFLPFPTALLAEYLREGEKQQVATVVYVGATLLMAVAFNIVWRYASSKYRLLNPKTPQEVVRGISRKYNTGLVLYVIAFGLAFVSYQLSLGLVVVLTIYFLVPNLPGLSRK